MRPRMRLRSADSFFAPSREIHSESPVLAFRAGQEEWGKIRSAHEALKSNHNLDRNRNRQQQNGSQIEGSGKVMKMSVFPRKQTH